MEAYTFQCPELIPQCDTEAGAVCKNVKGSYGCQCPEYTSGDGFKYISSIEERDGKYIAAPYGYNGGTGCKDTKVRRSMMLFQPNKGAITFIIYLKLRTFLLLSQKETGH